MQDRTVDRRLYASALVGGPTPRRARRGGRPHSTSSTAGDSVDSKATPATNLVGHAELVVVLERICDPGRLRTLRPAIRLLRRFLLRLERIAHELEPAAERRRHASRAFTTPADEVAATLAPRQREVLSALKAGRSEKPLAHARHIRCHTVHVYIKQIYRNFGVTSRAELLALWVSEASGPGRPE